MNLKKKAGELKKQIPALYLSLKDPETPFPAKLMAVLTVAYALSPVDLIPDFIPVLGYLDDVLLLPGMIALTRRLIPDQIWNRNLEKAEGMWQNGRPKRWYYAIPVLLFWIVIAFLIAKALFFRNR